MTLLLQGALLALLVLTALEALKLEFEVRKSPELTGAGMFLWISRGIMIVCGVAAGIYMLAWYVL